MKYFPHQIEQIAFSAKVRHLAMAVLGLLLSFVINTGVIAQLSPTLGQTVSPDMVVRQVYQNLSFLPLENEYISQTSGDVVSQNTLILRLLRYHEYVKNRPLNYRFDWQLTFADYFGINEPMRADRYPGYETLTVNPQERDREIITSLTRQQRNDLIDTLVAIYNPQTETTPEQPATNPNNSSEETKPSLPQPGDADLLLPVE